MKDMDTILKRITDSTKYIRQVLKENSFKPRIAIVLGSGLGSLADSIADAVKIPYTDIPGFPVSTTIGHQGNLILGRLGGKDIIAMQGRVHFYEGLSMSEVTMPVRVFKSLGVKYLLVSNAAGGINFDYRIGDLVVIKDHINMIPNPLLGPNLDKFGPRFPDMTHPYDPGLRAKAMEIASKLGIKLREGVYIAVTGPSYETPAEWNFFRMVGADSIGMSTVPEVIVARHADMKVFGMSVITNAAQKEFDKDYKNDGEDVVETAQAAAGRMCRVFEELIKSIKVR